MESRRGDTHCVLRVVSHDQGLRQQAKNPSYLGDGIAVDLDLRHIEALCPVVDLHRNVAPRNAAPGAGVLGSPCPLGAGAVVADDAVDKVLRVGWRLPGDADAEAPQAICSGGAVSSGAGP